MPTKIRIEVRGAPAPQGSKRHVGHGVMIESCKTLKPWREAVKFAALEESAKRGYPRGLYGPVMGSMVFTVRKPASAPKRRKTYPSTKPDLSKLLRSTEDALTDAGVWEDDARVIGYEKLLKVFPGEHPDALDTPGCVIEVWSVEAA